MIRRPCSECSTWEVLPDVGALRVGIVGLDLQVPALPEAHWAIFRDEVWGVHGEAFTREAGSYGQDVQRKLRLSRDDRARAPAAMMACRRDYVLAAQPFDVLVDVVFEGGAPSLQAVLDDYFGDRALVSDRLLARTPAVNTLGWPALAFPTASGPRQVFGPPGTEPALFAVARAWSRHD